MVSGFVPVATGVEHQTDGSVKVGGVSSIASVFVNVSVCPTRVPLWKYSAAGVSTAAAAGNAANTPETMRTERTSAGVRLDGVKTGASLGADASARTLDRS